MSPAVRRAGYAGGRHPARPAGAVWRVPTAARSSSNMPKARSPTPKLLPTRSRHACGSWAPTSSCHCNPHEAARRRQHPPARASRRVEPPAARGRLRATRGAGHRRRPRLRSRGACVDPGASSRWCIRVARAAKPQRRDASSPKRSCISRCCAVVPRPPRLVLTHATTLDPFSASAARRMAHAAAAAPAIACWCPARPKVATSSSSACGRLASWLTRQCATARVPASPSSLVYLSDRLRAGAIAAVTFCSPSAVKSLAVDLRSTRIICLGRTTAYAVGECGLQVDAIAAGTSMPALVEAVKKALAGVPA